MSQTKAQLINGKSATVEFTAGSASTPAVTFTGDLNTGIYSPGADQLAISTGGTGKVFVAANGNVGFRINPSCTIDAYQSGTSQAILRLADADSRTVELRTANAAGLQAGVGTVTNQDFVAFTGNTERLRITADGKVGIGTSSPSSILHCVGSKDATNFTIDAPLSTVGGSAFGNYSEVLLRNTSGSNSNAAIRAYGNVWDSLGSALGFLTSNNSAPVERLHITADGKVGIGTTNPGGQGGQKLTVSDGSIAISNNISSGNNGELRFIGRPDAVNYNWAGIRAISDINGNQGVMAFFTSGYNTSAESSTERMRIDSSGRLLVGTSISTSIGGNNFIGQFETTQFGVLSTRRNVAGAAGPGIALSHSRGATSGSYAALTVNDEFGGIYFYGADGTQDVCGASIVASVDGTPGTNDMPGRLVFATRADGASSPTDRMTITSDGYLLVATQTKTAYNTTQLGFSYSPTSYLTINSTYESLLLTQQNTTAWIRFYYQNTGEKGSISYNGTGTSYNTTSDYRLKENVVPVTDGIARLQQLKPSRFNFIGNSNLVVDGFIAHEVQDVVPEAITGEKDAVDDNGKPIYQGIDQSKLVPLLTAALQEAIERLEALETVNADLLARVITLENV